MKYKLYYSAVDHYSIHPLTIKALIKSTDSIAIYIYTAHDTHNRIQKAPIATYVHIYHLCQVKPECLIQSNHGQC